MRSASLAVVLGLGLMLCLNASTAQAWQVEEPAASEKAPDSVDSAAEGATAPDSGKLAANENAAVTDVRSATFQNVKPGETTLDESRKILGEPVSEESEENITVLTYKIDPFSKVDILFTDRVTTSIVIHLKRPAPATQIAKDLSLDSFRPAAIPDEAGQLLGIAYPERGVTFALVPGTRDNAVAQVLLEGVSAEPFVLRVLYDFGHHYTRNLADLDYAAQSDPKSARVPWLKAQTLAALGKPEAALVSAAEAVKLDPAPTFRLTYASLLGESGSHEQALAEAREILAGKGLLPADRARAECLAGDLLAAGLAKDYKQAIEHHQRAIKIAAPLANDKRFSVRRAAKQVLVDAHLAVAQDVVHGPWKQKAEVATKWLDRAKACAQEFAENDRGDMLLKLTVARKSLAAQAALRGELDPTAAGTMALTEARQLLSGQPEASFRRRVAWELGYAMHDAACCEQARGKADRALAYVDRALPLIQTDLADRQATPSEEYLLGRLYFVAGTVQAQLNKEHGEAVEWYEKASPRLIAGQAAVLAADQGVQGGRFVSMGVSYWQIEAKEDALRLTRQGVEMMQAATDAGTLDQASLTVPYGNLATMCQELGKEDEAKKYAALAAKPIGDQPKRR